MPELRETPYQPRVVLGSAGPRKMGQAAATLEQKGATDLARVLRAIGDALRPGQRISLIIGPEVGVGPGSETNDALRGS